MRTHPVPATEPPRHPSAKPASWPAVNEPRTPCWTSSTPPYEPPAEPPPYPPTNAPREQLTNYELLRIYWIRFIAKRLINKLPRGDAFFNWAINNKLPRSDSFFNWVNVIIAMRNISLTQRDLHFLWTHSLAEHFIMKCGALHSLKAVLTFLPEHFIMECRTGNIFDCSMTVLDDYIFSLFDHNQIRYYTIKIWLWSKM